MTSETGVNSDETGGPLSASAPRRLRVLSVIPGEPEGSVMIFARRQSASISALGLTVRDYHLADRTSPGRWWQELRRLRQEVRAFDPDLVHAHYGTVTALSAALTKGRRPLVITFRGSDLNPSAAVSGFGASPVVSSHRSRPCRPPPSSALATNSGVASGGRLDRSTSSPLVSISRSSCPETRARRDEFSICRSQRRSWCSIAASIRGESGSTWRKRRFSTSGVYGRRWHASS